MPVNPYRPLDAECSEIVNKAKDLGEVSLRDELGRFLPGLGKNTPRMNNPNDLKKVARWLTPHAMKTVWELMNDNGVSAATRLQCAQLIIERGHGKVAQTVDLEGYQGGLVVLPTVGGLLPAVDEGTTLAQECTSDEQKQG